MEIKTKLILKLLKIKLVDSPEFGKNTIYLTDNHKELIELMGGKVLFNEESFILNDSYDKLHYLVNKIGEMNLSIRLKFEYPKLKYSLVQDNKDRIFNTIIEFLEKVYKNHEV